MKLYTGRGDYGNTNLVGGRTVKKDDIRVEAYGTIDELNALLGLVLSKCPSDWSNQRSDLVKIQHYLFDLGSDLSDPEGQLGQRLTEEAAAWLETLIDQYDEDLPTLEKFILPGGGELAGLIHLARTVTRRAERRMISLHQEEKVPQASLVFINRLSDYFFVLARFASHDLGYEEMYYDRGGKVFHQD